MTRVLVLTSDHVNQTMAGPAIRSFEIARRLHAAGYRVTLAIPNQSDLSTPPFAMVSYDTPILERLVTEQDVVFFQGFALASYPFLRRSGARLVADLYGPFLLELLLTRKHDSEPERLADPEHTLQVTNDQIRLGDFFVCASEKQRDYWLGAMTALGRVNERTFAEDQSLRKLIDVMPFGLPSEPPHKQGPGIRETIAGIGPDDFVLLWGSAIYNWFDPLTMIRGVALAAEKHPEVRLVIMAASHPNPQVSVHTMEEQARELAGSLGLLDKHVFFNQGWIPYERRADWYLDADVGVSTHEEHLEARFAFRTRFLDYFWAGLPILCTAGDTLGEDVSRLGLGVAVPPREPEAVAAAIGRLADKAFRARCSKAVRQYAKALTWEKVAMPLVRYCDNPRRAPDLAAAEQGLVNVPLSDLSLESAASRKGVRYYMVRSVDAALFEGPAGVGRRARRVLAQRRRAREAQDRP